MRVTSSLASPGFTLAVDPAHPPPALRCAVYAIGNFDGVHRGHRAVIDRTREIARAKGVAAAVLTFEPHPADFFAGRPVVFRLTPFAQKARALQAAGLDGATVLSFDPTLASLSAEAFVEEILIKTLNIGAAVVGADFHFGKGRSGSPTFLKAAGEKFRFDVEILTKIEHLHEGDAEAISSSSIRRALARGDVEGAAARLGRPYEVSGKVLHGKKLGRQLGFPTANLSLPTTNRLSFGIYAVRARFDGRPHDGVASYGVRPTVNGVEPLLETYVFDFCGDLYDREIAIEFVARIRDEMKFESLDALKAAIDNDQMQAREALRARPFGVWPQIL